MLCLLIRSWSRPDIAQGHGVCLAADRGAVAQHVRLLQGVKGPVLKQMRPSKFKLPVSYVDLESGEELPVPEIMQRANSIKRPKVPAKIAKRRAKIKTLKTINMQAVATGAAEKEGSRGSPKSANGVRLQAQPLQFCHPSCQTHWPEDPGNLMRNMLSFLRGLHSAPHQDRHLPGSPNVYSLMDRSDRLGGLLVSAFARRPACPSLRLVCCFRMMLTSRCRQQPPRTWQPR